MEPEEALPSIRSFNDEVGVRNFFYEPLTFISRAQLRKQLRKGDNFDFQPLFLQNILLSQNNNPIRQQPSQTKKVKDQIIKDTKLKKIFQKTKQKSRKSSSSSKQSIQLKNELYSFNFDTVLTFSETPNFKESLQSPLTKFCYSNKQKIIQLSKIKPTKQKIKQLNMKTSPINYIKNPSLYFLGLALNMKNRDMNPFFFYNLAAYCEPFNPKIWEQFSQSFKKIGNYTKAAIVSKTGFLFNPVSNLAEEYLMCSEKAGFPPHEMRGLLSSLKNPLHYQKVLFESAKLQIKYRKKWRGLLLLFYYCFSLDFKSNISPMIIFLIKIFETLGFKQIVEQLLYRAINQKLTKYEVFNLFIQTHLRLSGGNISEQMLDVVQKKIKNIAQETRHRIYIDMAEAVKHNKQLCKRYLNQSLQTAKKCCPQQVNRKRSYRHIYLSILSMFSIKPNFDITHKFRHDDHLHFLNNKARFISGEPLQFYEFQDWKYYLHYGLDKNGAGILRKSYKKYNQGRLIAEYIHVMRLTKRPLVMLKFWRDKIAESPKSGQLWCEGGRIYSQLKQYSNAKKCFLSAIHFTPQYGDSFFQLLKIFLIEERVLQTNQLYKNFIVSQPFYGNVFSYLRSSYADKGARKLSLHEVWSLCSRYIQLQLHRFQKDHHSLTCCYGYNLDFVSQPFERRERLFGSYELIQNKFSK